MDKTKGSKKGVGDVGFARALIQAGRVVLAKDKDDKTNVSLLAEDEILSDVTEWIPTGFAEMDRILGGGLAVGRASEVHGPEQAGKSAFAQHVVRAAQGIGCTAIYYDFEAAVDRNKLEGLGIAPDRFVYVTPEDIEQGWDLLWAFLSRIEKDPPATPTLIVWDSIGGSLPRAEAQEKSSSASHVGLIARAMSKGCRKLYRAIAHTRAHMLWINQERQVIGGPMFCEPATVGGNAVKYCASQRIRLTRRMTLKSGERATGYLIQAVTKKNKLAPPHQRCQWVLDFRVGPSPAHTLWHYLKEHRLIKGRGDDCRLPWCDVPKTWAAVYQEVLDPGRWPAHDAWFREYLSSLSDAAQDSPPEGDSAGDTD